MADPMYAEMADMAVEMIGELGKPAVLVRQERSGPPHAPVVTPVEYACQLADIGYSITNRSGTHIQAGDKVGIMSPAIAVEPAMADVLRIDGADYRFVDLQPLNPGGLTVIYEYQARR